jgi:hypothetical protein
MSDKNDFYVMLIVIVLILITAILMAVPTIMKTFFPKEENLPTITYNGFVFTRIDPVWLTQYERNKQLYNLQFHFNPKEVENVPVSGELYDNFSNSSPVYITFDPDEGPDLRYVAVAAGELSMNIALGFNYEIASACTRNETEGCSDRPVVTCNDSDKSVVYIKLEAEPSVEFRGNCIIVKGKGVDLLKAVDNLLFRWYRIIK